MSLTSPRVNQRAVRLFSILAVVILVVQGCAASSTSGSGVYAIDVGGDTPGWIGAPAGAPVWAPDSGSIAWATEDGLLRGDLNGNGPVRLADTPVSGRPAWSPSGESLAFIDRLGAELVVVDASSGERLFAAPVKTDDASFNALAILSMGGPAWSPDGSQLAFNCWDGAGDEVCVIRSDGSGMRQITSLEPVRPPGGQSHEQFAAAAANTGPPAWSPDGLSLAVAAYPERRGAASGVFVVDLERGTARRVSSLLPSSELSWFPDGNALLFAATENGRSDAIRVSIVDDAVEKLTADLPIGAREPALAPDGLRLAVASEGTIVVMSLDGTVTASYSSSFRNTFPAWSPDGEVVAFAAEPDPISTYS